MMSYCFVFAPTQFIQNLQYDTGCKLKPKEKSTTYRTKQAKDRDLEMSSTFILPHCI